MSTRSRPVYEATRLARWLRHDLGRELRLRRLLSIADRYIGVLRPGTSLMSEIADKSATSARAYGPCSCGDGAAGVALCARRTLSLTK